MQTVERVCEHCQKPFSFTSGDTIKLAVRIYCCAECSRAASKQRAWARRQRGGQGVGRW